MKRLILLISLASPLLAQSGPEVVLYVVSPLATVAPAVNPALNFPPMAVLVHRFTAETTISGTIGCETKDPTKVLVTLRPVTGVAWNVGAYVGLGTSCVVTSFTYAILTPGASMVGGIAR